MLNERMLASPKNQISKPKKTTIIDLVYFFFSSIQAVKGSKSDIEELNAAIDINKKKIMENKFP